MTTFATTAFLPEERKVFDDIIKHAISPRPICFASTTDKNGKVNLSPFSFFNLMGQNPPICVFSPLRKMRDGSTKHTLENIWENAEVVINIVNYAMVQQQSLASVEFPKGVDEFIKSGFTPVPSQKVAPPRVAEAPFQLECKVREIISISDEPGAANLVIAEVLLMHVQTHLLHNNNTIDPYELDLVARMGADYYCRVIPESIFEVAKPIRTIGIGVDQIPESIRLSTILTGNHLGQLGNVEQIPSEEEIKTYKQNNKNITATATLEEQHLYAVKLLNEGNVQEAWKWLLSHTR